MLANDQHHDRHAQGHAESENITEQMSIGDGTADRDGRHRTAASVSCFRHAEPQPAEAGSEKRRLAVIAVVVEPFPPTGERSCARQRWEQGGEHATY